MSKKDLYREDWAKVRPSRVFRISMLRERISPNEEVRYLKESIRLCECGGLRFYVIDVLRENYPHNEVVPLELLDFKKNQKEELILHNPELGKFFEELEETENGYYLKEEVDQEIKEDDF